MNTFGLKIAAVMIALLTFQSFTTDSTRDKWNPNVLIMANSGEHTDYLNENEKKVVFYINLARMNGPLFLDTYFKKHIKEYDIEKDKWYKSLVEELKHQERMAPLEPSEVLYLEAKRHGKDMGLSGKRGHRSTSDLSFAQRMEQLEDEHEFFRECNQYGFDEPLAIVIDLLIDQNVNSLAHRRALLKPSAQYIGSSFQPHKEWQYNTVILLAGPKVETAGN